MLSLAKTAAYCALDICTAGRGIPRLISGERIRFPARWCRYYASEYEPDTFRFLAQHCRAGDTVFDIGAHLGVFTVYMARLVGPGGRVLSFEPTPSTHAVLSKTVRLNGVQDCVEVHREAVAGRVGEASFYCTAYETSNANSLVPGAGTQSLVTVPTTTIDTVLEGHAARVALLKIDAEGAELDVLRGARNALATARPAIYLSLHPTPLRATGGSLEEIWDLLAEYRFSLFDAERPITRKWFSEQEGMFEVHAVPAN